MRGEHHHRGHSFVLRIWQENDAPWRGWVQHVSSGDSRYFDTLPQLLSFVESYSGTLVKPVTPKDQEGEMR